MRHVGVLQARTDFSAIVAEVERTGDEVIVTRHGRPAVRIVPAETASDTAASRRAAVDRIVARLESAAPTPRRSEAEVQAELDDLLDRDHFDRWL